MYNIQHSFFAKLCALFEKLCAIAISQRTTKKTQRTTKRFQYRLNNSYFIHYQYFKSCLEYNHSSRNFGMFLKLIMVVLYYFI